MQLAALFLAATVFQSGTKLEIKDTLVGKGQVAKVGETVSVHYSGKLTSGKVFDSSKGKAPYTFLLGGGEVIEGWDKGIVGMKEGGKRTLRIPPKMAYGAQGSPPVIPPNSTLIFEVQLVKIEKITIKVLRYGTGAQIQNGDAVTVKYTGQLMDGKTFDSGSLDVVVGSSRLIKGFTQGIRGMRMGERRKVVIPPALGYGSRGAGGVIPPNATLVFTLELVKKN